MINLLKQLVLALSKLRDIQAAKNAPKPASHRNLEPLAPMPAPSTIPQNLPTLNDFCLAIKEYEGWGKPGSTINGVYYPNGTPSYRRNNPGNCRYSSVGYASIYGYVANDNGFAKFKDYFTGWLYLLNLIKEKAHEHPDWSILDLMYSYAPTEDKNNPELYARFLANHIGVTPDYLIKNFV